MQEQAVQCLILQAFAAACWAGQPIHLETSQPLSRSCRSILRHRNRCEDPTLNSEKWMRLDEMCCAPLNGSLRFSCQEGRFEPDGKPYIIQACVEEQVAPPGKTLRLSVRDDGSVHYELLVCHEGFYEDATRKSYEITAPVCRRKKKTCDTRWGEVLLSDGGATSDNLCGCGASYRVKGHPNVSACWGGFGSNSGCYCERCVGGLESDGDKNSTCVSARWTAGGEDSAVGVNWTTTDVINAAVRTSDEHVHTSREFHKFGMVVNNFLRILGIAAFTIVLIISWAR